MSTTEKQIAQPITIWHNKNYLLLWSGQIVSSVGTQISDISFPLLILALTNSPFQAGLVGAAGTLPYFIFSLPAGALVDRWNRKRVMIVCDTVRAISLGSIPLAFAIGHLTLLQLYLVSLIEGTLFVFFNIAEIACLSQVVRKEDLPTVAAQTEFTQGISSLLGRSLGGILYGLGRLFPFLTDSISYIISVISLTFVTVPVQEKREAAPRKLYVETWEGLHWLWHRPLLCFIALLGCIVHIVGSGTILLIIILAQHQHASPFIIGLVIGAAGIGAVIGSLFGGVVQKKFSFSQLTIGAIWLTAVLFPLFILAPSTLWLGVVITLLSGIMSLYGVVQFSYRLSVIPDNLQGRVNSVYRLILFGGDPIGLALTGILLQTIGAIPSVLIYSGALVVLSIATTFNRHVRSASTRS